MLPAAVSLFAQSRSVGVRRQQLRVSLAQGVRVWIVVGDCDNAVLFRCTVCVAKVFAAVVIVYNVLHRVPAAERSARFISLYRVERSVTVTLVCVCV